MPTDVAASDPPPAPRSDARSDGPISLVTGAVLALVVGAMVAVMLVARRDGHWWGDDWALYIRQAESLLDGRPGDIFDDNRFSVESSLGPPFSPQLYPWGFPMILVPAIATVGSDVDRLVIVPIVCSVVFACSWFGLARHRIGTLPAVVGVVAVTLTPQLLAWTELIQSEWAFLAVTFTVLLALDRMARMNHLLRLDARWLPLVGLGLGACAAFSVRKEGLAVTGAIAAAQLAGLIAAGTAPWRLPRPDRTRLGGRILLPHVVALVGVLFLQWVLPSPLVPSYDDTGLHNIWRFRRHHAEHLAEIVGLKRPWDRDPMILGSSILGWVTIVVFGIAALAGVVLAITRFRTRDLHLVVYAVIAFLIGGSFRGALNRYVVTVAPVLLLLALVAVGALFDLLGRRWITVGVLTLVVAAIAAGNVANAHVAVDRGNRWADEGAIEWGAQHPDAIEMFDVVVANSEPDDVIAAPKARAMTLLTDRRAIQVDDLRPLPPDVEVALVVTFHDADLADQLLADPDAYELVWRNGRLLVFRPTGATPAP